jgi:hypothetical protein
MRLFLAALLLAACGSSSTGPTDGSADGDGGIPCTRTCPSCNPGELCVTSSELDGFRGFCARPCSVTSDCPDPTTRCTQLFNDPSSPRVCVSQTNPKLCEGAFADPKFHCDFPPPTCNGSILQQGFSQPANLLCGTEFQFCPGGCVDPGTGTGASCVM